MIDLVQRLRAKRQPSGVSPPQQGVERMTSPAPQVGAGTVPDGIFLRGASFTTIGTGGPEGTNGNEAGAASDAYPPTGATIEVARFVKANSG